VGRKNIFGGNIYEISFSKNIYKNLFIEENSETFLSEFVIKNMFGGNPSTRAS
jgi:hypothetical protein